MVDSSSGMVAEDFGDEGSLVVEDQRFAIVPEWVITAEMSDAAFRAYSMLLRFGGTSGCPMPSRALLARRLHRSADSVDRALSELVSAGMHGVERRRQGKQFLSNRYYVRTSPAPAATIEGSRKSSATPSAQGGGGKLRLPLAAHLRPGRQQTCGPTQKLLPIDHHHPATSPPRRTRTTAASSLEASNDELLSACGITDIDELARRCMATRSALGQPAARWTAQCLSLAIRMAVVDRVVPSPTPEPRHGNPPSGIRS